MERGPLPGHVRQTDGNTTLPSVYDLPLINGNHTNNKCNRNITVSPPTDPITPRIAISSLLSPISLTSPTLAPVAHSHAYSYYRIVL